MDRIRLRKPMSTACVSFGKPLARFPCLPENIGHLWTGHIREFKHKPLCLSLTLKNCLSKFQPSAAPHHPGEANHQTWQGACQVKKTIVRTSAFLDLLHKGDGRFWVSQTKRLDTPACSHHHTPAGSTKAALTIDMLGTSHGLRGSGGQSGEPMQLPSACSSTALFLG